MNFDQLVALCRLTHEEMQKQAVRSVDLTLVLRNWLFGRYIVEYEQQGADRAAYGEGLIEALTSRLKPLGIKGVSSTRLRLYRTFYRAYGDIQPTPSGELTGPEVAAADLVKAVPSLAGWNFLLSCHHPATFPAPTVRPIPARGTAPGFRRTPIQALKGRPKTPRHRQIDDSQIPRYFHGQ